jgi:uncharacterized coiled-coil protein SlyX
MEARIARLESDVAHLRTDVADVKTDVRALRERMDTRMDHLEHKLEAKLDSKFAWLLSLQLATTAGLLGAMARGFGWI